MRLFRLLYRRNTEIFLGLVIIAYIVNLAVLSSHEAIGSLYARGTAKTVDLVFTVLFTVETALRIVILGFAGPSGFIRNSYNLMDLVIITSSWVFIGLEEAGVCGMYRLGSFKALRGILAFKGNQAVGSLIAVVEAVGASLTLLVDVFNFAMLLFIFYALVGVNMMAGAYRRRCAVAYTSVPDGAVYQDMETVEGLVPVSPLIHCNGGGRDGFVCPSPSVCSAEYGNTNLGYSNLDNVGDTLMILVQTLTLEGWNVVMFDTIDARGRLMAIYFVTFIIIGTYFLVSIFVAAISGVFLRLRKEHQVLIDLHRRRRAMEAKRKGQGFHKVVRQAITQKKRRRSSASMVAHVVRFSMWLNVRRQQMNTVYDSYIRAATGLPVDPDALKKQSGSVAPAGVDDHGARKRARQSLAATAAAGVVFLGKGTLGRIRMLYFHRAFRRVSEVLITINFVSLMVYSHSMPQSTKDNLATLQLALACTFCIECGLRCAAVDPVIYFTTKGEAIDFIVVALSLIGNLQGWLINFSMLRLCRFFLPLHQGYKKKRRFSLSRAQKSMITQDKTLWVKIFSAFDTLLVLFIFFLIVMCMFAIVAMQLFGGNFVFGGERARQHFDDFPSAFLTMFSVTTGEQWVEVLWMGRSVTEVGSIFFALYYVITNFILANLIIAVILETLELREFKKKEVQKLEILRRMRPKQPASVYLANGIETVKVFFVCLWKREKFNTHSKSMYSARLSQHFLVQDMQENVQTEEEIAKIADPWKAPSRQMKTEAEVKNEAPGQRRVSVGRGGGTKQRTTSALPRRRRQTARTNMRRRQPSIMSSKKRGNHGRSMAVRGSLLINDSNNHYSRRRRVSVEGNSIMVTEADDGEARIVVPRNIKRMTCMSRQVADLPQLGNHPVKYELPDWMADKSLGVFGVHSEVRTKCLGIIGHTWFLNISMAFSLLGVFSIFMEEPVGQPNAFSGFIFGADVVVAFFFVVHLLIHAVAQGLIFTPDGYLLELWNVVNTILLIADLLSLLSWEDQIEKFVRMVLTLRTLRIISRNEGMRQAASSLAATMPVIASMLSMALFIFIVFGIVGVRLYGGLFFTCNDESVLGKLDCVGVFEDERGFLIARSWRQLPYNFDTVFKAVLTLFEAATLDEWVSIMFHAMDVKDEHMQPRQNVNPHAAVYFVLFILIGSFFVIRSFVGVFVDQFGVESGSKLLTERQKLFRDMYRISQHMKPVKAIPRPTKGFRKRCFDLLVNRKTEYATALLVFANCVMLATTHYSQSQAWSRALKTIDLVFVLLYVLEAGMKIYAFGPKKWKMNEWNVYEGFIAAVSLGFLMPEDGTWRGDWVLSIGIFRVFRFIRYSDSLKMFLRTTIVSFPALIHIIGLLVAIIFIFSGVGTQYFAHVKHGEFLTRQENFERFQNSFLVLFHCMTGEGWRNIMNDLKVQPPRCTVNEFQNDCGYPWGSVIFFVTFIILCGYIFTNLFVAAILDYVTFGILREKSVVSPSHLLGFQTKWTEFDPDATGTVGIHRCMEFCVALGAPLGNSRPPPSWRRRVRSELLFYRLSTGHVAFQHMLDCLLLSKVGLHGLTYDMAIKREKEKQDIMILGATVTIQGLIRGFLTRRRLALGSPVHSPVAAVAWPEVSVKLTRKLVGGHKPMVIVEENDDEDDEV